MNIIACYKNIKPERKIQIIEIGLISIPIVTALFIWQATGKIFIVEYASKFAISWILVFSLQRRAVWARWLVGTLSILALVTSLQIFYAWDAVKHVVLSCAGIWMLVVTIFYIWTAYTTLCDKSVIDYFSKK